MFTAAAPQPHQGGGSGSTTWVVEAGSGFYVANVPALIPKVAFAAVDPTGTYNSTAVAAAAAAGLALLSAVPSGVQLVKTTPYGNGAAAKPSPGPWGTTPVAVKATPGMVLQWSGGYFWEQSQAQWMAAQAEATAAFLAHAENLSHAYQNEADLDAVNQVVAPIFNAVGNAIFSAAGAPGGWKLIGAQGFLNNSAAQSAQDQVSSQADANGFTGNTSDLAAAALQNMMTDGSQGFASAPPGPLPAQRPSWWHRLWAWAWGKVGLA